MAPTDYLKLIRPRSDETEGVPVSRSPGEYPEAKEARIREAFTQGIPIPPPLYYIGDWTEQRTGLANGKNRAYYAWDMGIKEIPVLLNEEAQLYAVKRNVPMKLGEYSWYRDDEREGIPEHLWERHYKLKPGDVYFDAGSYLARYGKLASKKVGPDGKVILVEPSPTNTEIIEEEIQDLSNVTLVKKAVWSEKRLLPFRVSGLPSGNRIEFGPGVIQVEGDTVDNILEDLGLDHVDLFTADVENAEVEMMKGMERCLEEEKIRNLAIAAYHNHPDGNYDEISKMLELKGYTVIEVWGGVVYGELSYTREEQKKIDERLRALGYIE